jgi:ATP-dependent exoDNAse (exonuclease V) beta subunit
MLDPEHGLTCQLTDPETRKAAKPYVHRRAEKTRAAREDAERRRLLYVAATRAQDYLLISGQARRPKEGGLSAFGWLDWLLRAFEVPDVTHHELLLEQNWGMLRVTMSDADGGADAGTESPPGAWEAEVELEADHIAEAPGVAPALMAEAPARPAAAADELTAAQVADLGALTDPRDGPLYRRRLRRALFYDAPATIETVTARTRQVSRRATAAIAHRALRAGVRSAPNLDALLRVYAWDAGIVDPAQVEAAAAGARQLLARAAATDVEAWLVGAARIYREMPFVYSAGGRVVHGRMDVVFQRPDGTWAIVDYKTASVRDGEARAHAQRYALQAGVYASALAAALPSAAADAPDVFLHYIQPALTVRIAPGEWEAALAGLDAGVAALVGP